jgi:DNA-directed RNA polymerase specialized sigma24 family protein
MTDTNSFRRRRRPAVPGAPEERREPVVDRAAAERAEETALLVRSAGSRRQGRLPAPLQLLAPRINSHLRRGGMTPADAENLLQDVWLVVWRKAALFDARLASARTWIFTLVRNRRIDLERAAQRDQRLVADLRAQRRRRGQLRDRSAGAGLRRTHRRDAFAMNSRSSSARCSSSVTWKGSLNAKSPRRAVCRLAPSSPARDWPSSACERPCWRRIDELACDTRTAAG